MKALKKLPLFLVLFAGLISAGQTFAQQETHPGVKLYLDGKYDEAIKSLTAATKMREFAKNGEIWNYLGLAYVSATNYKSARKSLEESVALSPTTAVFHANLAYVHLLMRDLGGAKQEASTAIELDPKNLNAHFILGTVNFRVRAFTAAESNVDSAIAIDPSFVPAYVLKSNITMSILGTRVAAGSTIKKEVDLLKKAVDTLNLGRERATTQAGRQQIDEVLASAKAFYDYFVLENTPAVNASAASLPEPVITPLKVIEKIKAWYTESARSAGIRGEVKLAVLFGADGKIEHAIVLEGLENGLDQQAIIAARQMRFEPMKRDGKPVPTVKLVEFNFDLPKTQTRSSI